MTTFCDIEIREIPGAVGYWISADGQMFSDHGKALSGCSPALRHKMTMSQLANGYIGAKLRRNDGTKATVKVHRLVLLAWVGPPEAGQIVRHLDGNKHNNTVGNLAWGTPAENGADAIRLGEMPTGARSGQHTHPERTARGERHGSRTKPESLLRGSRHGMARLSEDDVRAIRARYDTGQSSQYALARDYGITRSGIKHIVQRRNWKHVA